LYTKRENLKKLLLTLPKRVDFFFFLKNKGLDQAAGRWKKHHIQQTPGHVPGQIQGTQSCSDLDPALPVLTFHIHEYGNRV
jgi:hypothetical protein